MVLGVRELRAVAAKFRRCIVRVVSRVGDVCCSLLRNDVVDALLTLRFATNLWC